jgi:hypothetical protein
LLYGGTCYLKAAKDISGGNYSRPGREACIPTHNAPCETYADTDFHGDAPGQVVKVGVSGGCCDACAKAKDCVVGVLYAGTCYLKTANDMKGGSYARAGRTACKPFKKNSTSLPVLLARGVVGAAGRSGAGDGSAASGGCFFKSAADLGSKVTNVSGSLACVPAVTAATPSFTISATVPGELITDLQKANKGTPPPPPFFTPAH